MCAQFTDDDVGKRVINANGETVGIVAAIEHGTAHVEPDPGMFETIKAKLGWEGTDEESYPLQEEAVAEVTDDEIRLEGDLSDVGGSRMGTDTTTETESGTGTDDTGMGTDTSVGDDDMIGDDDDSIVGDDDDDLIGDDDSRR
ncbi:hypothetical protein [Natrialbaceae archaeon AArc-T1-2]|uniref:hypothetical protein n=1 Tax=Natrialbaceae archaeon AArc-T1-2 TaxID=3053904 RepID=UPI00255A877F|nr:hypothetical protein [Natrialbaceae archaeon AArc-T1-2]WIV66965.1 hypothetical protein QQ977_14950 [Natrialbaceae archaeon AArc-T1-2]